MTVWTRQHRSMLRQLEEQGRMIASKTNIIRDLGKEARLVLEVYDWLVDRCLIRQLKPADVTYPIWVSLEREATMLSGDSGVVLELEIDPVILGRINVAKWGAILNYSYIPCDESDALRHRQWMKSLGLSDQEAVSSHFYPEQKMEIVDSWDRLFDSTVQLGSPLEYGIVWEVKSEWVKQIL